jgi:hypothetical protein
LLRGNTGRFTSSPLIKSALEIIIIRNILSTELSLNYKNKNLLLTKNFSFKDMLNSVHVLGYDISIGTDSMRRLYEWSSVITHKAYRPTHASIWYALFVTNSLRNGILNTKGKPINKVVDEIIDDLIRKK